MRDGKFRADPNFNFGRENLGLVGFVEAAKSGEDAAFPDSMYRSEKIV